MKKAGENEGEKQRYGIGIDSGGTFTDGVIIDLKTGTIVKSVKVPTNHHHLLVSIRNCLRHLKPEKAKVAALSLSTTLATNAVVEGKGAEVGLFLIGQNVWVKYLRPIVFTLMAGMTVKGIRLGIWTLRQRKRISKTLKMKYLPSLFQQQ